MMTFIFCARAFDMSSSRAEFTILNGVQGSLFRARFEIRRCLSNMLLTLLQAAAPMLREAARPLARDEIVSGSVRDLISSMRETLRDAPGVGLAAPQVGVPIQLAIVEDLPEYWSEMPEQELAARERRAIPFHVLMNPHIVR